MNPEILGVAFLFFLTVVLANPLGKYFVKVFKGEKTWLDFLAPVENLVFHLSGIDPNKKIFQ